VRRCTERHIHRGFRSREWLNIARQSGNRGLQWLRSSC
jgi:hypothetical protein